MTASLLDLTDSERRTVDLIVVAHSVAIPGKELITIAGYTGGRDGRLVFEDEVLFEGDSLDAITVETVLQFSVEALRDGGITLDAPVWTDAVAGFEHHTPVVW